VLSFHPHTFREKSYADPAVDSIHSSTPDDRDSCPTALASLAGNIDPHHRVSIADLVLAQSSAYAAPSSS
jgi:hypothetical protein